MKKYVTLAAIFLLAACETNPHAGLDQNCIDGLETQKAARHQASLDLFDQCLKAEGYPKRNYRIAHRNLGVTYMAMDRPLSAESHFRTALAMKDTDKELVNMSSWLFKMKQFEEAMPLLNELLKRDPEDSRVRLLRGLSHEELGNREAAKQDVLQVARLGQRYPMLNEAMDRLGLDRDGEGVILPDSEGLKVELPTGFELVWGKQQLTQQMWEYLPAGQDEHNWDQKITIHSAKRKEQESGSFAQSLSNDIMKTYAGPCGSHVFGSFENQAKWSANGIVYCSDMDRSKLSKDYLSRRNSVMAFKVILTEEKMFLMQYEWHDDVKPPRYLRESGALDRVVKPMFNSMTIQP